MNEIRAHPKYSNIFISGHPSSLKLYTKNLIPGKRVYGERLITYKNIEYREWDPYRSKLAALLLENPKIDFLKSNLKCLYLGASSGTTISHLSASSIIAKDTRDELIKTLKKKYGDFGSGYPSDTKTINFLREWIVNHKEPPFFARKTWDTTKRLLDEIIYNKKITDY